MPELFSQRETRKSLNEWLVLLVIFLSRLPFLNNGYGSEEDAWGLAHVARNIALSGNYEVSRFPGHPLQEFIYPLIWQYGAFYFNLITALLSTVSIGFFIATLKRLSVKNAIIAGITLAFTPVIYISSTNAMDYMWALAFLMIAFYFLTGEQIILSGIFLGIATGCRITSLVFLIPFAYWLYEKDNVKMSVKGIAKLLSVSILVSFLLFFPAIKTYGSEFFSYVEKFPDQALPKIIYRGTIGVWGLLGFIDLITIAFVFIARKRIAFMETLFPQPQYKRLLIFSVLVILSTLLIYVAIPQKAAFLIPLLPFIIILIALFFGRNVITAFSISMIISCFTFGINLNDSFRGSEASTASINFKVSGQTVSLDVLRGPIKADYLKRKNKMAFADLVVSRIKSLNHKMVIIAGFWANDILVKMPAPPSVVKLIYYADEAELKKYITSGYDIYYLPEQDSYNDECYGKTFTNALAKSFVEVP